MKTTRKFTILFLALVQAACMETFIEPEPDDVVKIADGMIQSPQWLVDEVNRIADLSGPTGTGEKLYPWVYYVPYNGRNFIYIHGVVGGCYICGNFYFTFSGEPVRVEADHRLGLYGELEEARRKSGIGNDYNNLLWRYEYESTKSKSSSTRADRQTRFYTPNGTLVPDTWYRDETYITSAQIAAGRDYFKYAYPNAQEVSGPSTTIWLHVSSSIPTPPNTSYSKTGEDEGSEDYGTENGGTTE
ncbi:MAG: hypothetical protein LBU97_00945 [Alistipes sp.]|jgi:hypothetical protein|nr:hypothetical protein [Alistipes sp.]